ncbi:MAG: DUF1365 domain-containing protein [Kofleriaceae bacterium]
MTRSALYRGELAHVRTDELAHRTFRYPVYLAAFDLAELPALDRERWLFSRNRWNLMSFHDRDYADGAKGVAVALADLLAANELPAPATTRLVTNPRVLGYGFNPVSFWLNYDAAGELASVIAEVNNTYGGRFRYVLGPTQRISGARVGFRHTRELFVSPFLHGPARYELWFDAPLDGDRLAITMHVDRPDDTRVFTAHFAGSREVLRDRTIAHAALRYPVMTAQVIGLIHLQALRLRLRGVPYRRPASGHRPLPAMPTRPTTS